MQETQRYGFNPWVRKISCSRKWQPAPVFLPEKFQWTEEPGGLQLIGSQRVRHDWTNSTAANMEELISFQGSGFISFTYVSRSEIAGKYGSSICTFLRKLHCFPQWLGQFTPPPRVYRCSLFQASHQNFSPVFLIMLDVLTVVRW